MFFGLILWVIRFGQLHIWKYCGYHMKALRLGFPTMCLASQTDTFTDFGVKITLRRQWRRKQRLGSIYMFGRARVSPTRWRRVGVLFNVLSLYLCVISLSSLQYKYMQACAGPSLAYAMDTRFWRAGRFHAEHRSL